MMLHHFTCHRAAKQIVRTGMLQPRPQAVMGMLPVVWLTDFNQRNPALQARLGMGHHHDRVDCFQQWPPCNPLAARFSVLLDDDGTYVKRLSELDDFYPKAMQIYRRLPGAIPGRWWVSLRPIRVHLSTPAKKRSVRV
jgi:hypothetical protein